MRCDTCNELISLFIDGELDAECQSDLFMHLGECAECRSFLHGLLRIREIQHRKQEAFPAEIDRVVLDAVNMPKPARVISMWRKSISMPVPAAAAALLVVVGIFFIGLRTGGERAKHLQASSSYAVVESPTANVIYALPPMEVTSTSSSGIDKK